MNELGVTLTKLQILRARTGECAACETCGCPAVCADQGDTKDECTMRKDQQRKKCAHQSAGRKRPCDERLSQKKRSSWRPSRLEERHCSKGILGGESLDGGLRQKEIDREEVHACQECGHTYSEGSGVVEGHCIRSQGQSGCDAPSCGLLDHTLGTSRDALKTGRSGEGKEPLKEGASGQTLARVINGGASNGQR